MKASLAKREPEMLAFWQQKRVYERLMEKNSSGPHRILHDGPPYANGHIHMGHVLNKVLKDILVKYWNMKGYYAPFVPGWDCHGLPIEHQVDKKLGSKKYTTEVLEKRRLCREYAEKFVDIQREEFKRLGIFGHWQRPYLTMAPQYQATIVEEFLRFYRQGYIYRGKKPVHWCPTCITALAEAEVEYADKTSPSVYVKFRLTTASAERLGIDGAVSLVIWTTTPWTLPANLAIAVHPQAQYQIVKTDGEFVILAEALASKVMMATGLKGQPIKTLKGSELKDLRVEHPFLDRESLVVVADFVSTEEGTGAVHIAPGHGEEDYAVGLAHGLEIYAPVDDRGRFTIKEYDLEGEHVFKANEKIIEILKEKGALLGYDEITHSYPHCWRCKRPVIFRATEQWFISVEHNDLRRRCLEEIDRVRWVPAWGIQRIKSMVQQRPDWCISRQRSWGVPITVVYCSQCGQEVKEEEFFQKVVALIRQEGADAWFARDVKDFLPEGYTCSCGSQEFTKEKDILDVWFDSGVSHAAVLEQDERLSWPAFMYLEGSDQHRGWFQSSLFTGVATRQRAPYEMVLTHGFVVDGQGRKMSKSLGNVIAPEEIIKVNGAEILRLWVSAEDYRNDVRLSKEILNRLVEAYRKIRNTCRFMLGNLYDFDPSLQMKDRLREIDRWMMHRLQRLIEKVTRAYEEFEFHEVFHRIYNFCVVDLSAFYLDILKDCLYVSAPDSEQRRSAQWTIYQVLKDLTRLMAPVLSFTAEEIWQHIPHTEQDSVFLAGFPEVRDEFISEQLHEQWSQLMQVREAVYRVLETKRAEKLIGNSLEAKVEVFAGGSLLQLLKEKESLLQEILIVSQVEVHPDAQAPEDAHNDEELALKILVARAEGQKCSRCWNFSTTVGTYPDEPEVCQRCYEVLKEIND